MATFGDTRVPQSVWNRIVIDESGCWIWKGTIGDNGYGRVSLGRTSYGVHRLLYQRLVGPIEPGLHCDHLCRVRACCNPQHIEPVTPAVNSQRGIKWQSLKTHCPRGHQYDQENTFYDGKGYRRCRECNRERSRAHYSDTMTIAVVVAIGWHT